MTPTRCLTVALVLTLAPAAPAQDAEWRSLFNGRDLDGWTPKITHHDLGDNFGDTFRVEDGVIKVRYDKYADFGGQFGHLFYKEKFSHYRMRVEYRFVGEQCKGGPGWAFRNSGLMIHCQDPKSMGKDQDFPVSIEAQMLGGGPTGERPTASVCTPGTRIVLGGQLSKQHCTNSKSKTFRGDQWVTLEVEVHGNGAVKHYVNGDLVMEYEKPQLNEKHMDAMKLIADGAPRMLSEGYISLQSESHPCEFRKVEVKLLPN